VAQALVLSRRAGSTGQCRFMQGRRPGRHSLSTRKVDVRYRTSRIYTDGGSKPESEVAAVDCSAVFGDSVRTNPPFVRRLSEPAFAAHACASGFYRFSWAEFDSMGEIACWCLVR
jgi:hypothetical protein